MDEHEERPLVKFRTDPAHYTADACVIWCSNDRFYPLLKKVGKKKGWKHIDLVKVAGGAKAFAADGSDGEAVAAREFLVGQLRTSVRLHAAKRIVLMLHRDCESYGGSKAFADAAAERARYEADLRAARAYVHREIPAVPVDTVFADFDGLYEID
jgi:hypothetical protein